MILDDANSRKIDLTSLLTFFFPRSDLSRVTFKRFSMIFVSSVPTHLHYFPLFLFRSHLHFHPGKYWRIGGKYYDLTPWFDRHPGGRRVLELARDRFDDCTYAFEVFTLFTPRKLRCDPSHSSCLFPPPVHC